MWLTVGKVLKAFNMPPLLYHSGWRMVPALMSSVCLSPDRNLKCVSWAQSSSFTQWGFIDVCVSFIMFLRNGDVFDPSFFLSFFLSRHISWKVFSADDLKLADEQNVGVNHPDEERRYTNVESIGSSRCVVTFTTSPFFSFIPDTQNQRLVSRQALPVPW